MLGLLATSAMAIEPLPMPGPILDVAPSSGGNIQVEMLSTAEDGLPRRDPSMPPLDQIPPMPMPDRGKAWSVGGDPGGVMFHDATTGETATWPLSSQRSGLSFAHSPEPNYTGVGGSVPGAAGDGGPTLNGFGSMFPVSPLTLWPRRGNVKLFMKFTDTSNTVLWYTCSGSMADAGVVQTAAHCVYARNPGGHDVFDWADIVYVYPAWDGVGTEWAPPGSEEVIQNFGYAYGTQLLAGTNYINNGDLDSDAGLIGIARGNSRMAGMLTGWFGWAFGNDCATIQARTYNNYSYPAESCGGGLHTGRTMYFWSGTFDACPGNQLQINTTPSCTAALWGGMSGSGAFYAEGDNRWVHAVASNSDRNTYGAYAKLWEQFVSDRTTFVNNVRGNSFDLEALQLRFPGSNVVAAGNSMGAGNGSVVIANATNADPAASTYTLRVYLSTNNTITTSDTLLATWNYSSVDFAPMQLINFSVSPPVIPASTPAGTYWLGVILDPATDGTSSNNDSSGWDAQRITVLPRALFKNGFE